MEKEKRLEGFKAEGRACMYEGMETRKIKAHMEW